MNKNEGKRFPSRIQCILYLLKGCKREFAIAAVFGCILVLFELVNPRIFGYAVDYIGGELTTIPQYVLDFIQRIGGREYTLQNLWIFAIIIIGIAALTAVVRCLFAIVNSKGAERLVQRSRNVLYEQITALPFSWHDANKTGDIIQRCTSDVDMIRNFIADQLTTLVRMVLMTILALVFMGKISLPMMGITIGFLVLVAIYSIVFHGKIGSAFEKVDIEEGKLSAVAQENLSGVRVVRAFGREAYERERFFTKNEGYTKLWVRLIRILNFFWISTDVIAGFETIAIMSLGVYLAFQGKLTAGEFVAFLSYNGMMLYPIRQLGRVVSEMSKAGVSIDRIMYICNSEREIDAPDAVDYPGAGDIVFDHVSFAYPHLAKSEEGEEAEKSRSADNAQTTNPAEPETSPEVLSDISFTIKKGTTLGILGGTGSGKSTLVQLLDGLYDLPKDKGTITINGVDIRDIKRSELRKNVGIVLQEPYLFSRSIEDNILLSAEDKTHEEVERVSAISRLSAAISKFTEGYKTFVGEKGVTLSGGQKQRTAIAQMLIRGTDICIFDDSLSAVDAQTDAQIRAGLRENTGDATVILISHRITTIMQADWIVVLDHGKVSQIGSHEELIQRDGIYKTVYDLQLSWGEGEEEA